ncbi:hypothetical protein [Moraxella lacunata]|uniref:hypothetical protein n=1 Tax=Moraxella lacunata TaxID=477 RepID=UPI003EDF10E3
MPISATHLGSRASFFSNNQHKNPAINGIAIRLGKSHVCSIILYHHHHCQD